MSTSRSTFRRLAPEFASMADDDVDAWIEDAAALHDASVWGSRFVVGVVEYAAHLATQVARAGAGGGGAAGPITSRSAGATSESYGAVAGITTAEDAELAQTTHGLRYLALRNGLAGVGPMAVGA